MVLWDLLGIDPSTDFENNTIPSGTQWQIDNRHMAHELSAATRRQTTIYITNRESFSPMFQKLRDYRGDGGGEHFVALVGLVAAVDGIFGSDFTGFQIKQR